MTAKEKKKPGISGSGSRNNEYIKKKWDHFFQAIHFHRQCNHMTITSIYEYVSEHYMFIDATTATSSGRGWLDPFVTGRPPGQPAITSPHPWEPSLPAQRELPWLKRDVPGSLIVLLGSRGETAKPHHGRSTPNISPLSTQAEPDHRNCLPTNCSAFRPHLLTRFHWSAFLCTLHTHPSFLSSPLWWELIISVSSRQTDTISHIYSEPRKPITGRKVDKARKGISSAGLSVHLSQQFPVLSPLEHLAVFEQIQLTENLKKCWQKSVQQKLSPVYEFLSEGRYFLELFIYALIFQ